jgi:hypothetical protein
VAFQKEHGHRRVPGVNNKDSATYQLASWASKQRVQYKRLQQRQEIANERRNNPKVERNWF